MLERLGWDLRIMREGTIGVNRNTIMVLDTLDVGGIMWALDQIKLKNTHSTN